MIILFVLVGVLLLGGGVATIIDGLPYLVLERGFTQVIVGTVTATGGIVLLALSRVLAELRRVRATLSNAMMAISVASLTGDTAQAGSTRGNQALAAGAGLSAGVAAALIAGSASESDPSKADGQASADTASDPIEESDLLTKALDAHLNMDRPAAPDDAPQPDASQPDASHATHERTADDWVVGAGQIPDGTDPFNDADGLAADEPANEVPTESTTTGATDREGAEAPYSIADEPREHERDAEPRLDGPESEPAQERPDTTAEPVPDDEFGFLRESLAGRVAEAHVTQALATSDDSRYGETLPRAETWMAGSRARREPWFETPGHDLEPDVSSVADVEAADRLQPPAWPPPTREAEVSEPGLTEPRLVPTEPISDGTVSGEALSAQAMEATEDAAVDADDADAASGRMHGDVAARSEPVPPAASDEGVIGAYQVGEAHFTIFADGSIKARTPDGDYSFGSMDELKTYLASEKSRLGV